MKKGERFSKPLISQPRQGQRQTSRERSIPYPELRKWARAAGSSSGEETETKQELLSMAWSCTIPIDPPVQTLPPVEGFFPSCLRVPVLVPVDTPPNMARHFPLPSCSTRATKQR